MDKHLSFEERFYHGIVGTIAGVIMYCPLIILLMFASVYLSNRLNLSGDMEDFIMAIGWVIPTGICCFIFGIIGGKKYFNDNKKPLIGAAVGGGIGSLLTSLGITMLILTTWAR